MESPLEKLRRLEREDQAARAAEQARAAGAAAPKSRARTGIVAALVAVLALAFTKGKLVLLLLLTKGKLLLGALKLGPLLTTASTMGLSILLYAGYYGLWLAVGVVVTVLVHELGHGAAARLVGLRVGAPVFIPFFGAFIALKDQPRTTWVDACVGFGGPAAGTVAGLVALLLGLASGSARTAGLFMVLAWITFMINLFNLLPLMKLDGDRMSQPLRPRHWLAGALLFVAVVVITLRWAVTLHPFVVLLGIVAAVKGTRCYLRERRGRRGAPAPAPTLLERVAARPEYVDEAEVRPAQRRLAAVGYFGLMALLIILVALSGSRLPRIG
ncbi:MAG TPA: site-2 protease family protein [Polyangia bacterium]